MKKVMLEFLITGFPVIKPSGSSFNHSESTPVMSHSAFADSSRMHDDISSVAISTSKERRNSLLFIAIYNSIMIAHAGVHTFQSAKVVFFLQNR